MLSACADADYAIEWGTLQRQPDGALVYVPIVVRAETMAYIPAMRNSAYTVALMIFTDASFRVYVLYTRTSKALLKVVAFDGRGDRLEGG